VIYIETSIYLPQLKSAGYIVIRAARVNKTAPTSLFQGPRHAEEAAAMAISRPYPLILGIIVLYLFVAPTLAFGAGNIAGISKVEGQNCKFTLLLT
jgi:hypothetical protein